MDRFARPAALALVAVLAVACGATTTSPSESAPAASATPAASGAPTGTPAPADPSAALRIASPWVLDDEFPEVQQQLLAGLDQEGFGTAEVRHVTGPTGESAFLMATDAGLGADTDLEEYARRLSESSLTGGGVETIGDQEVALLQTDDVSIVAWIEPPLLLAVYASDADTARRIATAVNGAS